MSSDASICFTPRRAVGRMDAEGGVCIHMASTSPASLSILRWQVRQCASVTDSDGFHCV